MSPEELLESGKPYIKYGDQLIETAKWPDPTCKCNGTGTYGALAPKGTAENDLKLGGNMKCMCGSGQKYKKCCRERVTRLAKSGYRILTCFCIGEAFLAENPLVENLRKELAERWKITTPVLASPDFSPSGVMSMPKIDQTSELSVSSPTPPSSPESPVSTT